MRIFEQRIAGARKREAIRVAYNLAGGHEAKKQICRKAWRDLRIFEQRIAGARKREAIRVAYNLAGGHEAKKQTCLSKSAF